jgi:hypothetical protein
MPKSTLLSFCTRDLWITLNIINVLAYGAKIPKDLGCFIHAYGVRSITAHGAFLAFHWSVRTSIVFLPKSAVTLLLLPYGCVRYFGWDRKSHLLLPG